MKSVVWPPQNPSEDEPPVQDIPMTKKETTDICRTNQMQVVEAKESNQTSVTRSTEISSNKTNFENTLSSCEEITEFVSTATVASATISSTSASKSITDTMVQKKEFHEGSKCVISTSEQTSSNSECLAMYETQTSPPIQKCYDNPLEINIKNQKTTPDVDTSTVEKETTDNTKADNIEKEVFNDITEKVEISQVEISSIENKTVESKNTSESADTENRQTYDKLAETIEEEKALVKDEIVTEKENECATVSNITTENKCEYDKPVTSNKEPNFICEVPPLKPLPPSNIPNSIPKGFVASMVEALTIAPDRPFSPLPPPPPITLPREEPTLKEDVKTCSNIEKKSTVENVSLTKEQSPMFTQQPKRGITPIPPLKEYNPPEKKENLVSMPSECKPYIPADFKITIEPKVSREICSSPLIDALTTAPERPFTPVLHPTIERGSLRDALTIAPDRSYSPLPLNVINQSNQFSSSTQSSAVFIQTSSNIARPVATQTSNHVSERSEITTMQNTCKLQSSSEVSAFRPVVKQTFPPPQPEDICNLSGFPPISTELYSTSQTKQQSIVSESKSMQHSTFTTSSVDSQNFSSVKASQNFFEQLDQRESMSSTAVRSKSGLHKADNIPPYQKHFDQLPSQRGITPEISNAPAVLQRPITPTTEPPIKPRDKSQDRNYTKPSYIPPPPTQSIQTYIKNVEPPITHFHTDAPISMTFQPVTDNVLLRSSPARSRPTTPSMINKPAPIIPYYQMNLVTVEHLAPDTNLYEPSSPEISRSPTPKLRSRSPAQGPPTNPLKAQAPRIKESTPQRQAAHSLLTQATSNLRKEHEIYQKGFQSGIEVFNASGAKNWSQNQPSVVKEQRQSNIGFQSDSYDRGEFKVKEDSMVSQNSGQREMQSQNVSEYGNTIIQSTRKCFEEFESKQSAKVIEIRKGGSSTNAYQNEFNSSTCAKPKQVFPPPVMSFASTQQTSSVNNSVNNITATSNSLKTCQPSPSISGVNQSPVCDPTPSTGSSVGAAARGKTFGVSSAPKRGRGVLNKAALPGSRVALCASCNGNIR